MKRIIAIIHNHDDMSENVKNIIKSVFDNNCAEEIYVFTKEPINEFNNINVKDDQVCFNVNWPDDCNNIPKIRNWINEQFKLKTSNEFLHVLEDTTEIIKDPTKFITDLEHMMRTLDYSVWFSTVCDPFNFVYSKYNPRLSIELDKDEYTKLNLGKKLIFTSHSNIQWVAYDFSKISDDLLKFDEDFSIKMFYIIEFLSRRRNTKTENQLYFMNQYLTVESEYGTYRKIKTGYDDTNEDEEIMKKEDQLFKDKKINHLPDNNIDNVLEVVYKKLNEKI